MLGNDWTDNSFMNIQPSSLEGALPCCSSGGDKTDACSQHVETGTQSLLLVMFLCCLRPLRSAHAFSDAADSSTCG